MSRYAGDPLKTYPYQYSDPDISDAENLTAAAYYLIQAGRNGMADALIQEVLNLFEDAPVNKKLKTPCRVLGRASYLPHGYISARPGESSQDLCVPAPAYEAIQEEKSCTTARAKKIRSAMRRASLQWLPAKQAFAAALGTGVNLKFKPAVLLGRIGALAGTFSDMADGDAASPAHQIMGQKLEKLLAQNIIADDQCHSGLARELSRDAMYECRNIDCTRAMRYLTETGVKQVTNLICQDAYYNLWEIANADSRYITWNASYAKTFEDFDNIMRGSRSFPIGNPDAKRLIEIYSDWYGRNLKDRNASWNDLWASDIYRSIDGMRKAIQAALDVNDLRRMHDAIAACGDDYITELLRDLKAVDPELTVPDSLELKTARCVLAGKLTPDMDPEITKMARNALEPLMDELGVTDALSRGLPVIPRSKSEPGQKEGG